MLEVACSGEGSLLDSPRRDLVAATKNKTKTKEAEAEAEAEEEEEDEEEVEEVEARVAPASPAAPRPHAASPVATCAIRTCVERPSSSSRGDFWRAKIPRRWRGGWGTPSWSGRRTCWGGGRWR